MIRFGRLPMSRGWISRLFPLRIDSWTKKGSGEYKNPARGANRKCDLRVYYESQVIQALELRVNVYGTHHDHSRSSN